MNLMLVRPDSAPPAPSSAADVIAMAGITKVYDTGKVRVEALKGVDLRVGNGEFVAIVGPSGSGKSTLMNLVGCLDTPSDGTYLLRGKEVAGLDKNDLARIRNERVGFVFQNFNLLPQITAFENVEMPLMFGGVARKERKDRVTALLEKVGLADRMEHRPTELSGGQMQRVAVARALVNRPTMVLADEPTGNLDSLMARQVLDLLEQINGMGATIVMVTHDPELARRAHRNVQVIDGQITDYKPYEPRQHAPERVDVPAFA
jgi:putative ABC transport system ATP-binding protein